MRGSRRRIAGKEGEGEVRGEDGGDCGGEGGGEGVMFVEEGGRGGEWNSWEPYSEKLTKLLLWADEVYECFKTLITLDCANDAMEENEVRRWIQNVKNVKTEKMFMKISFLARMPSMSMTLKKIL